MEKPVRSLKEELHKPTHGDLSLPVDCALDRKENCCDGLGYKLRTQGSLTQAELCHCVSECASCFGLNRRLVEGKSKACRQPAPSRIVSIINSAGLPARYAAARLDDFSNFTGNGQELVRKLALWHREFNLESPRGLILGGPVGVGKTYLLVALAKNFASRGLSIRFIDFFQLLLELKAGYARDKSDANILNELIEVDVLFIDELGKGRNSDWELSILDQLVMGRYNQNKILVASSNYDLKPQQTIPFATALDEKPRSSFELDRMECLEQRIGPRIYSRLWETAEFLELTGDDFRKRNMEQKLAQMKSNSLTPGKKGP